MIIVFEDFALLIGHSRHSRPYFRKEETRVQLVEGIELHEEFADILLLFIVLHLEAALLAFREDQERCYLTFKRVHSFFIHILAIFRVGLLNNSAFSKYFV